MELKLDTLAPETVVALGRFSKAASRYYNQKFHKTIFITVGSTRVPVERIIPRSVESDYTEAKQALLNVPDQELRGALDRIDVTKLLDSLEGQSAQAHTDAYQNMVRLEKQLIEFSKKLK